MGKFREIRRKALLPDIVTSEIMAMLERKEIVPGDILPTETALAENFGVSRNVVREAIARLKSDGVIETKQGRGAIIKPLSERETFRIDRSALENDDNLRSFFELRGILEVEAAGLAAERRTEIDLADLFHANESIKTGTSFDDERIDADAQFHRLIGVATHNAYLATIIDYLTSRVRASIKKTQSQYRGDDLIEITIHEHQALLNAIKAKDSVAAQAAMSEHLRNARRRLDGE